jgi:hypothetical protein
MKYILLFVFMTTSFSSLSAAAVPVEQSVDGLMGMFKFVTDFLYTIYAFIFNYIPSLIVDFFVWLTAWSLKMKFYFMYQGLVFAHEVAIVFLDLIDISSAVNTAISALPQDMKQFAADINFFESLTLVVEAFITRLVYSSTS